MSTREPPDLPPAESVILQQQAPRPSDTPNASVPTPGVSPAVLKAPTAPTLPDWDPSMMVGMLEKLAAQAFTPQLPSSPSTTPLPPGPSLAPATGLAPSAAAATSVSPAAPTTGAPVTAPTGPAGGVPVAAPTGATGGAPVTAPTGSPTAGSPAPASPFHAPLSFDSLSVPQQPFTPIPLLDGGMHSPNDSAAPYWLAPAADEKPPAMFADHYTLSEPPRLDPQRGAFDPHALRREFPILQQRVNGKRLVWLDNAATTQKPQAVIDRLKHFYEHDNSNIHRAAHTLAARATDAYEQARETTRRFIGAGSKNEIVFVRGTTEGINLVAQSWGRRNINAGDEILITWLEHHANIVPWQMLANEKGAVLKVAPVDDRGQVILEEFEKLLGPKTRLVSFSQVSNALGTITPAREMISLAHRHGAKVLLDGAQGVSHMRVDVQALDCDFFVFSGHKIFAPTGIGAVYGKQDLLEAMPPWQGGGNMIQDVTFERSRYQGPPMKFEAGTGNIADAVGLGAALDWVTRVGVDHIGTYEHGLLDYATGRLAEVPGLSQIGTAPDKAGVLSFVLAGQKTEEVGGILDKDGIAVRSGHHCAQPILRRFGVEATVRASLAPYNTTEDIDVLVDALKKLQAGKG